MHGLDGIVRRNNAVYESLTKAPADQETPEIAKNIVDSADPVESMKRAFDPVQKMFPDCKFDGAENARQLWEKRNRENFPIGKENTPLDDETAKGFDFPQIVDKSQASLAVLQEIHKELKRAFTLHRGMNSLHEAKAVIEEEFDEFWELVKVNPAKLGTHQRVEREKSLRSELIQTAAMCVRAIVDLNL